MIDEVVNVVELRAAAGAPFTQAAAGSAVPRGGQVRTASNSSARLGLGMGTVVRLTENTTFSIEALPSAGEAAGPARLLLEVGRLFASLAGGALEVQTPLGVASVHGSYAIIIYDDGGTPDYLGDDVLYLGCVEGQCSLDGPHFTQSAGNLQQVTLAYGASHAVLGTLQGSALSEFLARNPDVAAVVAATLTAAPPHSPTPPPGPTETVPPGGFEPVWLCHATGNYWLPYVEIRVDARAALNGHRLHSGDIIPVSGDGCPLVNATSTPIASFTPRPTSTSTPAASLTFTPTSTRVFFTAAPTSTPTIPPTRTFTPPPPPPPPPADTPVPPPPTSVPTPAATLPPTATCVPGITLPCP